MSRENKPATLPAISNIGVFFEILAKRRLGCHCSMLCALHHTCHRAHTHTHHRRSPHYLHFTNRFHASFYSTTNRGHSLFSTYGNQHSLFFESPRAAPLQKATRHPKMKLRDVAVLCPGCKPANMVTTEGQEPLVAPLLLVADDPRAPVFFMNCLKTSTPLFSL